LSHQGLDAAIANGVKASATSATTTTCAVKALSDFCPRGINSQASGRLTIRHCRVRTRNMKGITTAAAITRPMRRSALPKMNCCAQSCAWLKAPAKPASCAGKAFAGASNRTKPRIKTRPTTFLTFSPVVLPISENGLRSDGIGLRGRW